MNPVKAFLAAIEPLRAVPTAVLCEKCGTVRERITHKEADRLAALGELGLQRWIRCRTKDCDGLAKPITGDDIILWRQS